MSQSALAEILALADRRGMAVQPPEGGRIRTTTVAGDEGPTFDDTDGLVEWFGESGGTITLWLDTGDDCTLSWARWSSPAPHGPSAATISISILRSSYAENSPARTRLADRVLELHLQIASRLDGIYGAGLDEATEDVFGSADRAATAVMSSMPPPTLFWMNLIGIGHKDVLSGIRFEQLPVTIRRISAGTLLLLSDYPWETPALSSVNRHWKELIRSKTE